MQKHFLSVLAIACTMGFLCGCARNIAPVTLTPISMTPPQGNRVGVCSLKMNFIKHSEKKEYALDLSKVPEVYQPEIKFYTVNALNYLGFKEKTKSDLVIAVQLADSHMNVVSQNPHLERKTVSYMLTASEKDKHIWTITSSCSGRASEISNYWFPGLAASFLPYFGETRNRMVNVAKHPLYLSAVSTPPAK